MEALRFLKNRFAHSVVCGAALAGIFWFHPVFAADTSPDDTLLFEVHLDQTVVSDGLSTIRSGQRIYLPLGEFSRVLTISITSDPVAGTAQGFIISEDRDFSLDYSKKTVTRSRQTGSVDPGLLLMRGDDLYVESGLLSQWFPITLSLDTSSLIIQVTAKEQLPIQSRMQRDRLSLQSGGVEGDGTSLPNYDSPYRWIDRPFIDQTVASSLSKRPGLDNQTQYQYTTSAAGDLLGLQSNLYLSGNNLVPFQDHRLTLGRDDPDAGLLGPLKARSVSFGAASLPGLKYVASTDILGTGAVLTNRPLTRPSRFDSTSFSGELLPGWDVELFHNGIPIRHQQNAEEGRYRFDDVPVLFGLNDFRLIFHGPQGQQREEHRRFLLEDSLAQPGEFFYSTGFGRMGDGSFRAVTQFDKSIVTNLSATAGVSTISLEGKPTHYFNLGLRSYLDSFFITGDAIASGTGGRLESLGLRTSLGGVSFSLTQAFMQDFSSEIFEHTTDPIVMQSKLRMDTFIPLRQRIPISLELERELQLSGSKNYTGIGRISTFLSGLSISNSLQYQLYGSSPMLVDSLQLGRRIAGIGLRGGVSYNIRPVAQLATVDLTGDKSLGSQYTLMQSVMSDIPNGTYRFTTTLTKGVGQFGFSVNGGWSSVGETFVGMRMNIALGVEPRRLGVYASAEPITNTGALSARVFVDQNMNGSYDEGERPVPGASFIVDGGEQDTKTDEQGILFLHHLPSKQRVNVVLNSNSIDDPQLTPGLKGVRLLPRPGRVAVVDFPLRVTTEVDGTLYRFDSGKKRPAANVEIELVDENQQVVSTTKSSYDGFYVLSAVPPGKYQLRVALEQAERLHLKQTVLKSLRVLPNSNFISGMDSALWLPSTISRGLSGKTDEKDLGADADRVQARGKGLFFVSVGAFADPVNIEKITHLLVSEGLNHRLQNITRPIPMYRVRVATAETQKKADELLLLLHQYGYPATVSAGKEGYRVYSGPYYSQKAANQERTILAAAISSSALEVLKETRALTVFKVGGFVRRERAEEVRAQLMETGLIDESLIVQAAKGI